MTQRINRYQPPEPDALLTYQDMTIALDVDELLGLLACEVDASRMDAWPDDCHGTARCEAQKVTDDEHFRERLSRDPSYRVRMTAASLPLSLESRLRLLKDRAASVRIAVACNPEAVRALVMSAEGKAALTEAVVSDLAMEVGLEEVYQGADEATAVRLEDVMRALVARRVAEDSPAFSLTVGHDEPATSILRTRLGQAKAVSLIIAKYRAMRDVVSEEPMTVGLEDADRLDEICSRFADDPRAHVRRAAAMAADPDSESGHRLAMDSEPMVAYALKALPQSLTYEQMLKLLRNDPERMCLYMLVLCEQPDKDEWIERCLSDDDPDVRRAALRYWAMG